MRFFNQTNPLSNLVQWINVAAVGLELLSGRPTNFSLGNYVAAAFGLAEEPSYLEMACLTLVSGANAAEAYALPQEDNIAFLLMVLRISISTLNMAALSVQIYNTDTAAVRAPAPQGY